MKMLKPKRHKIKTPVHVCTPAKMYQGQVMPYCFTCGRAMAKAPKVYATNPVLERLLRQAAGLPMDEPLHAASK